VVVRVGLDVSAVSQQPAGAGRYIVELAKRINSPEVDATLIAARGHATRWQEWSPSSTVIDPVPSSRPLRLLYEATMLGRGAAYGVDVWHGPHYTMPRRTSKPVVVTICDMTFFTNPEWHERAKVVFFRRAMQYSVQHATELISISETTTRALRDVLRPSIPITTIPLGVDHDRFSPAAAEAPLSDFDLPIDRPFIFFLGTFEPRKGLDVLLEAFRHVGARVQEIELWLAGQAGWHTSGTDDVIAAHPFASRIRRLGYVDDAAVPVLMRQARAVAYPSRGEGFGLPVLEALACGAEVVTTAGTVMEEVAGSAATLTSVGDSGQLADALLDALRRSAGDREARSHVAISRAAQFTWTATASAHRDVYRRLAKG
jgi:glycosyltransferase involved in cell wall biosynthesis